MREWDGKLLERSSHCWLVSWEITSWSTWPMNTWRYRRINWYSLSVITDRGCSRCGRQRWNSPAMIRRLISKAHLRKSFRLHTRNPLNSGVCAKTLINLRFIFTILSQSASSSCQAWIWICFAWREGRITIDAAEAFAPLSSAAVSRRCRSGGRRWYGGT